MVAHSAVDKALSLGYCFKAETVEAFSRLGYCFRLLATQPISRMCSMSMWALFSGTIWRPRETGLSAYAALNFDFQDAPDYFLWQDFAEIDLYLLCQDKIAAWPYELTRNVSIEPPDVISGPGEIVFAVHTPGAVRALTRALVVFNKMRTVGPKAIAFFLNSPAKRLAAWERLGELYRRSSVKNFPFHFSGFSEYYADSVRFMSYAMYQEVLAEAKKEYLTFADEMTRMHVHIKSKMFNLFSNPDCI